MTMVGDGLALKEGNSHIFFTYQKEGQAKIVEVEPIVGVS